MNKAILTSVLVFYIFSGQAMARMTSKVTTKVLDEKGTPVEGANVKVSFKFAKDRGVGLQTRAEQGISNKSGLFTATGQGMASISVSAVKDGYYKSGRGYEFTSSSKPLKRWEPWNPIIEVVLKKKRNPIPMYMKYLEAVTIPVLEVPVGYDLEIGDWVSPYGNGAMNDLVFTCNNKYEGFRNAETSCEIGFSNKADGFMEFEYKKNDQSYYKWPFTAPENGYNIKKINKWMSVHLPQRGYKSNYKENINYLFRVRSEVDKDGKLLSANYGKIKGDIRVYKKAQVNFFYYFNQNGTRNLEEDPEKNLFDMK